MANRSSKHWAPRMLGICAAIAAGAWAVNHYILVPPQAQMVEKEEVQIPTPAPQPVVLPETRVRSGTSVTTTNGVLTVHVLQITGAAVKLTVNAKTGDVYHFHKAAVGRLVIPAPDAMYYVDLLRIQGSDVDLTVSKNR